MGKFENKLKRKRGRPQKILMKCGSKKEMIDFDKRSKADEHLTPVVNKDLSPIESLMTFTSSSNSSRPIRNRKPNQKYNILLSELDAMVRQMRRHNYCRFECLIF